MEDNTMKVESGPFIILSGRMDIFRPSSIRTQDLSETELLWIARFRMRRMPSQVLSLSHL